MKDVGEEGVSLFASAASLGHEFVQPMAAVGTLVHAVHAVLPGPGRKHQAWSLGL